MSLLAQSAVTSVSRPLSVEIIGLVAGFGTTFAALPDLLTMWAKRSHLGMNPRMAAISALFQCLWLAYGVLIHSPPIVFWNVIAIATNSMTVYTYRRFSAQAKKH